MKTVPVGLAADHGGFGLKQKLAVSLRRSGFDVKDFGALTLNIGDDYPDFVIPLARSVARGQVKRGIAICSSGVGACIAANKIAGVRAGLIHDIFSARQGVEDDDMNVLCLGAHGMRFGHARNLVQTFLKAEFFPKERFKRRLRKIHRLEKPRRDHHEQ